MALALEDKDTKILTEPYTELDIKIIQDIIDRIVEIGDLSLLNQIELNAIKEKDRKEIFQKTLEEVGFLTAYMNGATKKIYNDYAHYIIKTNKDLLKYNKIKTKLNPVQLDMLNSGLKETQTTLKNLTGTVAFASETTYVEAVDKAYLDVKSGKRTFEEAVYDTYKDLAQKGVKLTDNSGKKVQLETAIERNLRAGLQNTANRIDDNLFNDAEWNGYEVEAHSGARPTHAIAQGRQYALTQEDAIKYGVDWWYDILPGTDKPVAELWNDYNCQHTYQKIKLGQAVPNYTKKELRKMKNASVDYNGEKMSLYNAKQKQHYYESKIRNTKKAIQSCSKSNDSKVLRTKESLEKSLKNYQNKYRDFNKATGLSPDYTRTRI